MEIPQELIDLIEPAAAGLYEFAGVTGVGIGLREENGDFLDELAVRILVADGNDPPAGLPDSVGDLPVSVVEFPVEPLFAPDTRRYDDLLGGAQIEPAPSAAGTLGAVVLDGDGNWSDRPATTCRATPGRRSGNPPPRLRSSAARRWIPPTASVT